MEVHALKFSSAHRYTVIRDCQWSYDAHVIEELISCISKIPDNLLRMLKITVRTNDKYFKLKNIENLENNEIENAKIFVNRLSYGGTSVSTFFLVSYNFSNQYRRFLGLHDRLAIDGYRKMCIVKCVYNFVLINGKNWLQTYEIFRFIMCDPKKSKIVFAL